ncbi:right-handed parallel beta-helix repeat-containing protein [Terribacillus saccharophilus]|uniref:right-handed parallel beta-helix repeat-containing protein n=1 Tax=Terribacillus saccharophilus TaxID=361277 RepID=UPI002DCD258C|nr:right-handed parallel beta-helix repeat-containing protein [Terribacillus saccharophilus]
MTTLKENKILVGPTGDFPTINMAIDNLKKQGIVTDRSKVIIELQQDFIMKEQVHVDSTDLGWITITSIKSPVLIDRKSITKVLIESRKPAFYGSNGAVLPKIGCQFRYTDGSERGTDGITVAHGSKVQLLPLSGVDNADRGLGAYYNSEAYCYMEGLTEGGAGKGAGTIKGVSFQNCTNRAFMATYGSSIKCARAQLQNCKGDNAVYVIWMSTADIYQSNISNSLGTAVHARDGSWINARETNVEGSNRGYHALHNGKINARYDSTIWSGNGARNCKEYAVLASYNSTIDASRLPVDGSNVGVHASNASSISFIDNATATNCKRGIHATGASLIDCRGVNASDCQEVGILAEGASKVEASNALAKDCGKYGIAAYGGSEINAEESDVSGSAEGITAQKSSKINAKNANALSCTKAVVAFEQGIVNASYMTGSGTPAYQCGRGSIITASHATGSLSKSKNAITVDGIIFA